MEMDHRKVKAAEKSVLGLPYSLRSSQATSLDFQPMKNTTTKSTIARSRYLIIHCRTCQEIEAQYVLFHKGDTVARSVRAGICSRGVEMEGRWCRVLALIAVMSFSGNIASPPAHKIRQCLPARSEQSNTAA